MAWQCRKGGGRLFVSGFPASVVLGLMILIVLSWHSMASMVNKGYLFVPSCSAIVVFSEPAAHSSCADVSNFSRFDVALSQGWKAASVRLSAPVAFLPYYIVLCTSPYFSK